MKTECSECGGRMEEGFLIDREHGNVATPARWAAGKPKRSSWFGISSYGLPLRGVRLLEITTLHCEKCGFLKSFATCRARVH